MFIPAYTGDERGENWGRLLEFQDRDGLAHRWAMPMLLLKGSGEELCGELAQWREQVANYCVSNSRLVFAVSAAFASMLIEPAGDESGGFHYRGGSASIEFIEQVIKNKHDLQATIRKVRDSFVKEVLMDKEASGQAERVAARFGLVAVAGELATAWGITGWNAGEAEKAAHTCFDAWVNARGGTGKAEATTLLDQVKQPMK